VEARARLLGPTQKDALEDATDESQRVRLKIQADALAGRGVGPGDVRELVNPARSRPALQLAGLDAEAVRRQMGVVIQDGRVLPGTILSTIVGPSAATLDDAWEAARLAGLDEDIRRLPGGMDTVVGEGGATFFRGQLQRLLIARAVVAKLRGVLFDEATSASTTAPRRW
jgi:hypothetical protein